MEVSKLLFLYLESNETAIEDFQTFRYLAVFTAQKVHVFEPFSCTHSTSKSDHNLTQASGRKNLILLPKYNIPYLNNVKNAYFLGKRK
jgi:hypothetical protein